MQCYNFEFNPPDPRYSSQGKLTVLKRYTVSQNYTLQNGTGKVFHMFTSSSLPNHAECFFDRRNSHIDGNRANPIMVYKKCQLPYCTCQGKQTTPQTNPLQTQDLPKVGMGDKPKTQEIPKVGMGYKPKTQDLPKVRTGDKPKTQDLSKVGMGDKPKTQDFPKVGTGDKPKTQDLPKVGMGDKPKTNEVPKVGRVDPLQTKEVPRKINQVIAKEFCSPSQIKKISQNILVPMPPTQESPQRNVKFEQDRKRCRMDTNGKNPHENERVHRDTCVSDLVWPICKIDNSEYSK